jgi:hypothetical protein
MFRRNISLPSSGLKNKTSKSQRESLLANWFRASFLISIFFDLEDVSDMFPRNVGWLPGAISQKIEHFLGCIVYVSKTLIVSFADINCWLVYRRTGTT